MKKIKKKKKEIKGTSPKGTHNFIKDLEADLS